MPEIVVCEEHSQVYDTWQARGFRGLDVAHIDFHCDLRGLLVDRRRQRARFITSDGQAPAVDSGNYLGVGTMDGTVDAITWIHDSHGGRRYDAGTVKYESDLTAVPHRLREAWRPVSWRPLSFQEVRFESWGGPEEGQHLDIDWDGLASIEYPRERTHRLVDRFLARDWSVIPDHTYVVYSPGYSDPDRVLFDEFVQRLAHTFDADLTILPAPTLAPGLPKPPQDLRNAEHLKHRLVLGLHRIGIY